MKNCVYRFLNKDNEIIYIGKAKDLKNRLNGHNHLPAECYDERINIEYVEFEYEEDMNFAERYYIQKNSPKYNTILANKIINISSFELDNKIWVNYKDDYCNNLEEKEEVTISNKKIIKDMQLINVKVEAMRDMIREDWDNDLLQNRFSKLLEEQENIKKEFIEIFQLNKEPQWLIEEYIKNNTTNKSELIQIKIEEIEDKYYKKCIKSIEEKGYYKLDIYEEIDQDFVYSELGGEKKWYRLLEGQELKHLMLKYKINTNIKNKIVMDIIKKIENRIKATYGDLNRKIIMESTSTIGSYMRAFYPDYEYMEFEKPFIVHEIKKIS